MSKRGRHVLSERQIAGLKWVVPILLLSLVCAAGYAILPTRIRAFEAFSFVGVAALLHHSLDVANDWVRKRMVLVTIVTLTMALGILIFDRAYLAPKLRKAHAEFIVAGQDAFGGSAKSTLNFEQHPAELIEKSASDGKIVEAFEKMGGQIESYRALVNWNRRFVSWIVLPICILIMLPAAMPEWIEARLESLAPDPD